MSFELRDLLTAGALIISAVMMTFSAISLSRSGRHDRDESRDALVRIDARTAETDRKVGEQSADLKSINAKVDGMRDRLVVVEQSTKSAHHRIDGIERELHVGGTD